MRVFAHIDKIEDFQEYWNTLHGSLNAAVSECPDWIQKTSNALNKAMEEAWTIRNEAKRALDMAYECADPAQRQREIERCEPAYAEASEQYEKLDEQHSAFVRESAQYLQTQQELLADIKAIHKQGAQWLTEYTQKLKDAKLAITEPLPQNSTAMANTVGTEVSAPKRTLFELASLKDMLDLTDGDPAVVQAGGAYCDVKENVDSSIYEVHHIPPRSVFTDHPRYLPCIAMLKADHEQTSSYAGRMGKKYLPYFKKVLLEQCEEKKIKVKKSTIPYLKDERPLETHKQVIKNVLAESQFAEAVRNELFEIREAFGEKYDGAIAQYLDALQEYIINNGVPQIEE